MVFNKICKVAFFVCLAILVVLGVQHVMYKAPINEAFLEEYKEFDAWEQVSTDPEIFKVTKEGTEVGYLAFTSRYGYQSDVEIATLVGMDGVVISTETYKHDETPSYYSKLIGGSFFSNNFVGDSIQDGFSINTNVDAITKATISSNAAAIAIDQAVDIIGNTYLGIDVTPATDNSIKFGYQDIILIGMFVLAILATKLSKFKWLGWFARIYSVVMMGFVIAQFITLSVLVAFFTLDWPSVSDYLRWYIMIFGTLALILFTGRNTYCSFICPFGAFQELEAGLAGKITKPGLDKRIAVYAKRVQALLVFIAVALALYFHNLTFVNYEPFSLLFGQVGEGVQWALLPITIIGGLLLKRFYCKFLCPVGYILVRIASGRAKLYALLGFNKRKQKAKAAKTAAGNAKVNEVNKPAPAQASSQKAVN